MQSEALERVPVLVRVRELAPTLRETELRVLLGLTAICGNEEASVSLDDLAVKIRVARSAALRAVRSLNQRGLIWKKRGRAGRTTNRYRLTLQEPVPVGPKAVQEPPCLQQRGAQ